MILHFIFFDYVKMSVIKKSLVMNSKFINFKIPLKSSKKQFKKKYSLEIFFLKENNALNQVSTISNKKRKNYFLILLNYFL